MFNQCVPPRVPLDGRRARRHAERHPDAHDEPGRIGRPQREDAAHQLRALPHADDADALPAFLPIAFGRQALPAILDLEQDPVVVLPQPHPGFGRPRMPAHVGEGFLHDPVDVDRRLGRDDADRPAASGTGRRCRAAARTARRTTRAPSRGRSRRESPGAAAATACGSSPASAGRCRALPRDRPTSGESAGSCRLTRPSSMPMAVSIWPNSSCSSRENACCRSSCIRSIRHDRLRSCADSRSTCSNARRFARMTPASREPPTIDEQHRHQDDDLAHDALVDRLIELRRFLLHAVVQHEELRHHARRARWCCAFDGGPQQQGRSTRSSAGLRLRERLVDRAPRSGRPTTPAAPAARQDARPAPASARARSPDRRSALRRSKVCRHDTSG